MNNDNNKGLKVYNLLVQKYFISEKFLLTFAYRKLNMVYITRKEHFCAAHKLYNKHWSPEENNKVFGKCASPNFHGHNYDIYVTIKGKINPESGFVINLFELSDILKHDVVELLDHKNLNLDIEYFKIQLPSIENLSVFIWNLINKKIKRTGAQLHCIKIQETENNFAEYYGE